LFAAGAGDFSGLIFLAILIFIFYFMLIRPQRRRQQQHQSLVESVKPGDEIVTIGGLHGIVQFVGEQDLQLEIAPNTTVRLLKSAIARVVAPEDEEDEEDEGYGDEQEASEPIELETSEEERK
jgi:preprotein translocase subunit YajC